MGAIAAILCATVVTACGSCTDARRQAARTNIVSQTASTATATQSSTTATGTATVAQKVQAEAKTSAGDTVPAILPTAVSAIDTTSGSALKHLTFQTTQSMEAGRYVSEFLVVVRAKQASCVRFKTRSTPGLSDIVSSSAATGNVKGNDPCSDSAQNGEAATSTSTSTSTATATSATTATSTAVKTGGLFLDDPVAGTVPITAEALARRGQSGFSLASQSAALCASRLFRMQGQTQGLESVVNKTARLAAIGSKVRLWVDEEFSNICTGGSDLNSKSAVSFGPLDQLKAFGSSSAPTDKLWLAQVQNLVSAMDNIYSGMTGTFGSTSDVDGNGYVEILMSPDVNRFAFDTYPSYQIDDFEARPIYRPQDLTFYNAQTNPLSNEGEVLYLWTPDPGGIYNYTNYPSANSIASNYAKGYLASQLMTLIVANQRLLVQKQSGIPDPWLLQSLAALASAYYAGNDFTSRPLAQYLTSRPAYVSLDTDIDAKLVGSPYLAMAQHEQYGMRAMFGWYLHSRLCGAATVAPCAALKKMITSSNTGFAAITDLLGGETTDKTLNNFGLSVGVSLLDKPDTARGLFSSTSDPTQPPAPVKMPELSMITTSTPQTEEEDDSANLLTSDKTDNTFAGPFPAKHMLMFQMLSPDNDLEFKIAQNAVAYIYVTGLIDSSADVTAYLGQGLNVSFIPAGDRDGNIRRVHFEKLSQNADTDLRPENLTAKAVAGTTYASSPVYNNLDYTLTPTRQLWILGAIDNYSINIEGSQTPVSDSDAFDIKINPCDGVSDLAACQAKSHHVTIQAQVRDFSKQVAPMLLVTTTNGTVFRGESVLGRVKDIDSSFKGDVNNTVYMLCESGAFAAGSMTATLDGTSHIISTASPHGLVSYNQTGASLVHFTQTGTAFPSGLLSYRDYSVIVLSTTAFQILDATNNPISVGGGTAILHPNTIGLCANGSVASHYVYDQSLTAANSHTYLHNYDNFLQMGLRGFPYTTLGTVNFTGIGPCPDYRCFYREEAQRQHLNFAFDKNVIPTTYYFTPSSGPLPPTMVGWSPLSATDAAALAWVKNTIDTCSPADPQSVMNQTTCMSVAGLTAANCVNLCGSTNAANKLAIEGTVASYLSQNNYYGLCTQGMDCSNLQTLITPGTSTKAWISPSLYFYYSAQKASQSTYYHLIEPQSGDAYCLGDATSDTAPRLTRCWVKSTSLIGFTDIRQQLNVATGQLFYAGGCEEAVLDQTFQVCIDDISYYRELTPDRPYYYRFFSQAMSGERTRVRSAVINSRSGEVIAKPERIQAVTFKVPGTGAVANIIVGGRKQSQGKYLIRAHVQD